MPGGLLQFEIADRNIDIIIAGVDHSPPVGFSPAFKLPQFRRPLAFNAHGGVGESLQASERNLRRTNLANAISSLTDTLESPFDVCQFAAFDFSQLRADFVLGRIEGGVYHVASRLLAELFQQA